MKTVEEVKQEIGYLESIRHQFPKDHAIYLECTSYLQVLAWVRGMSESPSDWITKFLDKKKPDSGVILIG